MPDNIPERIEQERQEAESSYPTPQTSNVPAQAPKTEEAPKRKSYVDLYKEAMPYRPLTPEQIEARRRRDRATRTISAIGDGLSALSNLFFTTQYAPNVEQKNLQLSTRYLQRKQQLDAEMEQKERAYTSGLQRAEQMEEQYRQHQDAMRQKELDRQLSQAQWLAGEEGRNNRHAQTLAQQEQNNQRTYTLGKERNEELKRHNAASEANGKAQLGLSYARLNFEKQKHSEGGGIGKGSNKGIQVDLGDGSPIVSIAPGAKLALSGQLRNLLPQSEVMHIEAMNDKMTADDWIMEASSFLTKPGSRVSEPMKRQMRSILRKYSGQKQQDAPAKPLQTQNSGSNGIGWDIKSRSQNGTSSNSNKLVKGF